MKNEKFSKNLKTFEALNQNSDFLFFLAMVQITHSKNMKVPAQKTLFDIYTIY